MVARKADRRSGGARRVVPLVAGGLILALGQGHSQGREDAFAVAAPNVAGAAPRLIYPAGHLPALALPNGEQRPIRSLLNVARPLLYGDYVWNDAGVVAGRVWVRVDLRHQIMSVFRNGHEIGAAVILYGTDGKPTPTGMFPVLERAEFHRSSLYDAEMPYMLRLTGDGVAIHASAVHEGAATHGCVGIPAAFARLLFAQVRRGDQVVIV